MFFGGDGDKVADVIDAASAAVIFVVDLKGASQLLRTGHPGSTEFPDIRFLDSFANTNEHTLYPNTILITVII